MIEAIDTGYDYISADETDSGAENYADTFDMTYTEFCTMIEGKNVLDLGSGNGMLATETEYWKLLGIPAPNKVDSLNIRYASSDFKKKSQEYFGENYTLSLPKGAFIRSKSILLSLFGDKVRKQARKNAEENFLGMDWNDLSNIKPETYDVVLSVRAFPWYTDFQIDDPDTKMNGERASKIIFGEKTRKIFQELLPKVKSGGRILLQTHFSLTAWRRSKETQIEFENFFKSLNCTASIRGEDRELSAAGDCYIEIHKL